MDFLFPLHKYLAEYYPEIKIELEQLATVSDWQTISFFSKALEKLSQHSPEGCNPLNSEVARLRHLVLSGFLTYSQNFTSGSRLSRMLEVDCPFDEKAFRSFVQRELFFDYRRRPAKFCLEEGETLFTRISDTTVTYRRDKYFRILGHTEVVAVCAMPLTSTIEAGTVGKTVQGLRSVLAEAWKTLQSVMDKPELWTHPTPSSQRRAFEQAQDAAQQAVSSLSPEILSFLKANSFVWRDALENAQVPASCI